MVGLAFEAKIAAGPGVAVVGRLPGDEFGASVSEAVDAGCKGIISFGIAGGLAPHLRPGDCVVASGIADGGTIWPTCQDWSAKLLRYIPGAHHGVIAGVDVPIACPMGKGNLHQNTSAIAVDMESHMAARLAASHDIPFVAMRVVADPAHRLLPQAAIVGMRPDGSSDLPAVLRTLVRNPKSLIGLLRTAADAAAARVALSRRRQALGPSFALFEEREITPPLPAAWSVPPPAASRVQYPQA